MAVVSVRDRQCRRCLTVFVPRTWKSRELRLCATCLGYQERAAAATMPPSPVSPPPRPHPDDDTGWPASRAGSPEARAERAVTLGTIASVLMFLVGFVLGAWMSAQLVP